MQRSAGWRLFAVCWANLQFALPAATLLADAKLSAHAHARFSHNICPSCDAREVQPQFDALDQP